MQYICYTNILTDLTQKEFLYPVQVSLMFLTDGLVLGNKIYSSQQNNVLKILVTVTRWCGCIMCEILYYNRRIKHWVDKRRWVNDHKKYLVNITGLFLDVPPNLNS